MLGAVDAQARLGERHVEQGAVVGPLARAHVRAEVAAGDAHARDGDDPGAPELGDDVVERPQERDLALGLQRADRLRDRGGDALEPAREPRAGWREREREAAAVVREPAPLDEALALERGDRVAQRGVADGELARERARPPALGRVGREPQQQPELDGRKPVPLRVALRERAQRLADALERRGGLRGDVVVGRRQAQGRLTSAVPRPLTSPPPCRAGSRGRPGASPPCTTPGASRRPPRRRGPSSPGTRAWSR